MLRRVDKKNNKKKYMQTINVFRTDYSRKKNQKKSVDRKINTKYRISEKKSRRH
jgi:hypothetical protein